MQTQDRPELIIFDCDGVLIDSQIIQCQVDALELSRFGFAVTPEELAKKFIGRTTSDVIAHVEAVLGFSLPDDFESNRDRLVEAAYASGLRAMEGIARALEEIDLPVCVASNATMARIRSALATAGLLNLLDGYLFGANLVPRPKPAPDLFLYAAKSMGAHPSKCLVIEDSEAGIQAATAAGMRVAGFHGGGHCYPGYEARLLSSGASVTFNKMSELPSLIRGM